MDLSDDIIARLAAWAESHPAISEVWLFGSRAREDNHSNSDADIAIRMPGEVSQTLGLYEAKADAWQNELAAIAGLSISLQILNFSEVLDQIVQREGVQLWKRS